MNLEFGLYLPPVTQSSNSWRGTRTHIDQFPAWSLPSTLPSPLYRSEAWLREPTKNTEGPRTRECGTHHLPRLEETGKEQHYQSQWELEPRRGVSGKCCAHRLKGQSCPDNVKGEGINAPSSLFAHHCLPWPNWAEARGPECWRRSSPHRSQQTPPPPPRAPPRPPPRHKGGERRGWGGGGREKKENTFLICFMTASPYVKFFQN